MSRGITRTGRAVAPLLAVLALALLAGCGKREAEPAAPELVLRPASFADLPGWREDDPRAAMDAFRSSCRVLERKDPAAAMMDGEEAFGRLAHWQAACREAAVAGAEPEVLRRFFESRFAVLELRNGNEAEGLFTGYYEPLLQGSRRPGGRYTVPLHGRPADLVSVDLAAFDPELKGRRIGGRVEGGRLLPYFSRAQIDGGALAGRELELLWVDDPIAKFFLQIQGSGQVELEDGSRVRVAYADQNGQPYRAIGRDLVEMGALEREKVSLQTIREWLKANPSKAQEIMERNRSYVFFSVKPEAGGEGPVGAQNVPLTPGRSLAVDRKFLPLGLPMWLAGTAPFPEGERRIERLVVAQDTGGAIRGPVRGDVFWGAGPVAEHIAGHMKSRGRYWALVPRAAMPSS
ncbi:MltA domain-containing protein [Geminicoccaceae bacterium 1502E]|nr:MltA domain-containing protein [Geminicoccaceae bacterium 1502E]